MHPDGRKFDILEELRKLPDAQVGDFAVVMEGSAKDGIPAIAGRLVGVRKSGEAAENARRKLRAEAKRKGKTPNSRSLEACEYIFLFTTLSVEQASTQAVLEIYRFRWQVEMAFKRMKGIIYLDQMAAKDSELCRTFLLAKLLAMLLIEDLSHCLRFFPPGDMDRRRPLSLWRLYRAIAESLRHAVGVALSLARWKIAPKEILDLFRDTPRKRLSQCAQTMYLNEVLTCNPSAKLARVGTEGEVRRVSHPPIATRELLHPETNRLVCARMYPNSP